MGTTGVAPAVPAGTPLMDVISADQNPFLTPFIADQASVNSRRMVWDVENFGAAGVRLPLQWFGPVRCTNGMVVKLDGGATALSAQPLSVTVLYKPDLMGWSRYQRSRVQYAGAIR
jgi:hypothetical protein